ncbi:hypothetical protein BST81_20290 [Leptolyngbya sp. 'hensonii']|uniref:DUF4079 domain-containing protein n=1 Tax=Leptolyngbya sp. 'hensonii' TaxID=1922337 RepID=UPI00094F9B76|nr:DUF4079 domain-containing protein [Leptolyngbya sp. 'hensonii']OLP16543.1 hypothetical protein BST81_20290 [Leptolyngbya sp. 'hensonii']
MEFRDFLSLIHPALAVSFVFPLIGIVVYYALQTRQRRLQTAAQGKSRIPIGVGNEHLKLGRWLTGSVVGIALIGLAHPIFKTLLETEAFTKTPAKAFFIVLMFILTIASLVLLYRAHSRVWRGVFGFLSGAGLVILGCQDGVYRLTEEWYWSHYYFGMAAALLMIFSLAIVPDIYQDRSNRWRIIHTVLNTIALLLFIGQGMTGTRDLLEIPLGWQEPYLYQCNFDKTSPEYRTCPNLTPPPKS